MAGNSDGAKKAARKLIKKYGADHYKKLAKARWASCRDNPTATFKTDRELARRAGAAGGKARHEALKRAAEKRESGAGDEALSDSHDRNSSKGKG